MQEFDYIVKICTLLEEKKAENIIVIDTSKISSLCDNVIICSINNIPQARAVAGNVLDKIDLEVFAKEGYGESNWVVLDYGFVIVHILSKELREYYNLEKLYTDGKTKKYETIVKELDEKRKKLEKKEKSQAKKEAKKVTKNSKTIVKSEKEKKSPKTIKSSSKKPKEKTAKADSDNKKE